MSDSFSTGILFDRFVCFACLHMTMNAKRMLPHMGAYVCHVCLKEHPPVNESEISNRIFTPWNPLEVIVINEYQVSDLYLPFLCNNEHHLVARTEGLVCPECIGFELTWVYSWVLDGGWKGRF